jgi:hypothetical protein
MNIVLYEPKLSTSQRLPKIERKPNRIKRKTNIKLIWKETDNGRNIKNF